MFKISTLCLTIHHKQLQCIASKCTLMLISQKRTNSIQPPQLTLNGTNLTRVAESTTTNIWVLSLPLTCHGHFINPTVATRKGNLNVLVPYKRHFHQHPTLLKLYCSFVQTYASIVWNPGLKGNVKMYRSLLFQFVAPRCVNLHNTQSSGKTILSVPQARTNYYQHFFFPNIIMQSGTARLLYENSILYFKRFNSFLEC